jgi:hypothetical protein
MFQLQDHQKKLAEIICSDNQQILLLCQHCQRYSSRMDRKFAPEDILRRLSSSRNHSEKWIKMVSGARLAAQYIFRSKLSVHATTVSLTMLT